MSRFDGDGRVKLMPLPVYVVDGTQPISVTQAAARRMIAAFTNSGHSCHSGLGGTLWVVIEHCKVNNILYTLKGHKGLGYEVIRG